MRLPEIERPSSLLLKLVYWLQKRTFGKVLAPFKTIYARSTPIMMASLKIRKTDKKLTLSKDDISLIRGFVANINNCEWCNDYQEYEARKNNIEFQKTKQLMDFKNCNAFSEKEKALLSYVDEVTITKTVSDDTFENLKKHFNDKQIVEITWVIASENYFNMLGKPLGLKSDELNL